MQQALDTFQRMWDAYATGQIERMLEEISPVAVWHPIGLGGTRTGRDEIRLWAEGLSHRYRSVTIVFDEVRAHGDRCVVATGHVRMFDAAGRSVIDADVGWVCEFGQDGLVSKMTACDGHAVTHAFASERVAQLAPG